MRKLASLALTAALVPALGLGISTLAFAQANPDEPDMSQDAAQQDKGAGEQQFGRDQQGDGSQKMAQQAESTGKQHLSRKPEGAVYAGEIIGQNVKSRGTDGDTDVGEVTDLVIGEDGRILGVVISTGGIMGLGEKSVALPWDHVDRAMEDDKLTLSTDMDQDALENTPTYEHKE